MNKLTLFVLSFFCIGYVQAQTLSAKDSTLFDFWVGEWDATWKNPDGSESHGANSIQRYLGDKIIKEHFVVLDGPTKGFIGESFSVLDKRSGQWKQTWIDNGGGYLDFIGEIAGDTRIFSRSFQVNGKTMMARMRFYDIKADSFMWDWESSADEGRTWKVNWRISYTRKSERN